MGRRICYALISRGKIILCDHRLRDGDYESICQPILENVSRNDEESLKVSYDSASGKYICHTYLNNQLVYICVTETVFDKNVVYQCLFELEEKLLSMGLMEGAQTAGPYALKKSFSHTMAEVLSKYSSSDVLGRMETQVEEVTGVMRQNINKVVDRGENLDNLTERSDLLAHASTDFRVSATKLRKKLCWKNAKKWVVLFVVVIALLLIVGIIIVCILAAKHDL
jgi:vesicle-associated membrane protein 7